MSPGRETATSVRAASLVLPARLTVPVVDKGLGLQAARARMQEIEHTAIRTGAAYLSFLVHWGNEKTEFIAFPLFCILNLLSDFFIPFLDDRTGFRKCRFSAPM
jgi:hypothetical protein